MMKMIAMMLTNRVTLKMIRLKPSIIMMRGPTNGVWMLQQTFNNSIGNSNNKFVIGTIETIGMDKRNKK